MPVRPQNRSRLTAKVANSNTSRSPSMPKLSRPKGAHARTRKTAATPLAHLRSRAERLAFVFTAIMPALLCRREAAGSEAHQDNGEPEHQGLSDCHGDP